MKKKEYKEQLKYLSEQLESVRKILDKKLRVQYAGEDLLNTSLAAANFFVGYTGNKELLEAVHSDGTKIRITLS